MTREHLPHSHENKEVSNESPHLGGDEGGLTQAAGDPPDDGPQDPAAIQREPRNQVKESQRAVDKSQILGYGQQRGERADHGLEQAKENRQSKTRSRAGQRNPEL